MAGSHLLGIEDLAVTFNTAGGPVRALRSVDLDVDAGETVAIMGESGCGKSVLGHAAMRLLDDIATVTGSVTFCGRDIYRMDRAELEGLRGRKIALVPQNPSSAFNPVIRIGRQIQEMIEKSGVANGSQARRRALEYLARAGFSDARSIYDSYPHRLSGGMCERALIAMAVSVGPELIIADEPTKGLDTPAKREVLDLLRRASVNSALIMITHDFRAAMACERMVVMYSGEIVEEGSSSDLIAGPGHPYLRGLIDAQPSRGMVPVGGRNAAIPGMHGGCGFRERCAAADAICSEHPDMKPAGCGHMVRCHHPRPASDKVKQESNIDEQQLQG